MGDFTFKRQGVARLQNIHRLAVPVFQRTFNHVDGLGPGVLEGRKALGRIFHCDHEGQGTANCVGWFLRTGADLAKTITFGADAFSLDQGILMNIGCMREMYFQNSHPVSAEAECAALGIAPGFAITSTPANARRV